MEPLNPIITELLKKRGVKDINRFINPLLQYLEKTSSLIDIHDGLKIADFIKSNKRIILYGDYDVDGVSCCALFGRFFREIGFSNFHIIIPSRFKDGYGLNINVLEREFHNNPFNMIITFDCGITSVEEVNYLKKNGVFVVITDHHLPKETLPEADIIINPKLVKKEDDGDYHLCGCGIAFKLIHLLKIVMELKDMDLKKYLDIVGLATVADVVPLVGDNRILVKHGLEVATNSPSTGIKVLKKVAGLNGELNAYHHGFVLGPRINASGRLDIADRSLHLLLEEDEKKAETIAFELETLNEMRRRECDQIFEEAEVKLKERKRSIVLYDKEWNKGVVGIVASRLVERYSLPVVLFGTNKDGESFDGLISGSGRSLNEINLFDILSKIDKMYPGLMVRYGGHAKACGLVIYEKDFLHFKNAFEEIAKNYPDEAFTYSIRYDLELSFADITEKFIEDLALLEPFGYGNETPRFLFRNIELLEYRRVGDGKHISMTLSDGNSTIKGIWFDCPQDLIIPGTINLVGYPLINSFNGNREIQIRVTDLVG